MTVLLRFQSIYIISTWFISKPIFHKTVFNYEYEGCEDNIIGHILLLVKLVIESKYLYKHSSKLRKIVSVLQNIQIVWRILY